MFVLDKHGEPLMPCHPARARELLASGRAVVVRHTPFAIRLKDRTVADSRVAGVEAGIDPGSRHTGLSIFTQAGGVRRGIFALQLDHRGGWIRDKLTARAAYRRGRRSRNLRYRAPRFNNRTRPKGWLAPSLRHRVDGTLSWITRLRRWAPIRAIHVERVAFDTSAMAAGRSLSGTEYQQGTLAGYEVREYLLARWERRCAYCDAQNVPLNIDHIRPRARGGSDRISNLTLAVHAVSGGRTKWNRHRTAAPKSHTLDALHVGEMETVVSWPSTVLVASATGRGSYARTAPDRYGFPRLRRPRTKQVHGFATGDLVRAIVPAGKKAGTHVGRVAVRTTGSFNIRTVRGLVQSIGHRHVRLLQRADGYGYTTIKETTMTDRSAFSPRPEGQGFHAGGNQ
ncbi:RNA-guided endonuclease IscB [Planomonospora parontospora]|uniref:RNA-guided endonuclease IscB n=1 Tax=Planomonospora parontospora TaxID=58119 RepID=UPI0019432EF0|nr:RNA-guided endonuclease IscB [Planomonospora parontospora]